MLAQLAAEAAARLPRLLAGPGLHPLGLRELRVAVAGRLTARGLASTAEQILITQGALHGWDLVLRALTGPGDAVIVEQPTYPSVLDAARSRSLRLVPLAVTENGWQHVSLPRAAGLPVLAHVTPDFQNPTGVLADRSHRRALLDGLPQTTALVVDETFAELGFGEPITPVAALDRSRRTITVGSLSKCVWPGLRVGWVRADSALVRRIGLLRAGQDLATPVLEQLFALECMRHLDEIIHAARRTLRERRDHVARTLREVAPRWNFTLPTGGLNLWVDLGKQSSAQLVHDARAKGVLAMPGSRFSATGTHEHYLRLPYCLPTPLLDQAVSILASIPVQHHARQFPVDQSWTV
jgi:DNA-binding transcriptional MocR family regulator